MYPYHSPRGVDDYYDSDIDSSSVSSSQCDSHDDNSSVMQKVVTEDTVCSHSCPIIVVHSSKEFDAGRTSLIQQFTSQFDTYNITCYVSSGAVSNKPVHYRYD